VRLFILFASPPERDLEWKAGGVEGCYRFINRFFRFLTERLDIIREANHIPAELNQAGRRLLRATHQAIAKVEREMERGFHFNTAISRVMELANLLYSLHGDETAGPDRPHPGVTRLAVRTMILLLAPMIPHVCEEMWEALGEPGSVSLAAWPEYDRDAARDDEITVVVQVNGKLRSRLAVAPDTGEDVLEEMALADGTVQRFIAGKQVRKVIVVKNRLVNVVAN
jgi:leucyl-tRNA synthetase